MKLGTYITVSMRCQRGNEQWLLLLLLYINFPSGLGFVEHSIAWMLCFGSEILVPVDKHSVEWSLYSGNE